MSLVCCKVNQRWSNLYFGCSFIDQSGLWWVFPEALIIQVCWFKIWHFQSITVYVSFLDWRLFVWQYLHHVSLHQPNDGLWTIRPPKESNHQAGDMWGAWPVYVYSPVIYVFIHNKSQLSSSELYNRQVFHILPLSKCTYSS